MTKTVVGGKLMEFNVFTEQHSNSITQILNS